jgi:hypothetical protein
MHVQKSSISVTFLGTLCFLPRVPNEVPCFFSSASFIILPFRSVAAKRVGDGPGPRACRALACLTPVLVCIGIALSPYIVALVLLSELSNEEGIETADSSRLMLVGKQLYEEVLLKLL